jgi:hypothetical protein
MARPKGTPKTGGRQKGTPNRTTASIREWLIDVIGKNQRQIEKDLKELEPGARLQIIARLLPFVVPKMESVNATIDIDKITDEQLDIVIDEITKDIDNGEEDK